MFRTTNSELKKSVQALETVSNALGFHYINGHEARRQFFDEINQLIAWVKHEVDIHCMSQQGAVKTLQEEIVSLRQQEFQMITRHVNHFAAVEKKSENGKANLVLKQVGFVGGGSQIFAGFGVCMASMGAACAAFGSPLIAHGLNNFYENGYYLLFRKEVSGYTRESYRKVARVLGYSGEHAEYAYNAIDIALSSYSMLRKVPVKNSFRLFRTINSDFIQGWREMGVIPLTFEFASNTNSFYSVYQLKKGKDDVQ
ncbi:DUF4225 domain-containing protein [Erwinia oleae]|uniref:DUF4225 domain-containing protein n=1 Tax=Erwinia oleae TaxID=796334 RepID=UPI0005547360|nr:DUF4225 domain-containing protein [Erwinia oleae]